MYTVRLKISPKDIFHFVSSRLEFKREIAHIYYLFMPA